MSLPARSDIDPTRTWDLTHVFESPEAWDEARETLLADLDEFDRQLDQLLADPSATDDDPATTDEVVPSHEPDLKTISTDEQPFADALERLLETVAELHCRRASLELYATLAEDVTDDPDATARTRRLEAIDREFEPAIARALVAIDRIEDDRFEASVDRLDELEYYASNLRQQAEHRRSPEVEAVIGALEGPREGLDRTLLAMTTDDVDSPTVERPDGETVTVTYGRYRREISHPDRDYRRRVYEAVHEEFDRFEETMATAYAEKLEAIGTLAELRGYESIREFDLRFPCYPETGLVASFPPSAHDVLVESIRENLDPWKRARSIRAEALGVDSLRPWDLRAPLGGAETRVSYEEARDRILAAVEPLGEAYRDRAWRFFDDRRIDSAEYQGKRNDKIYCPSSPIDGAFVLTNYQDDPRSMFYLAHELGHALHVEHHREGPAAYATCPRPIEEVPSFLHELLLIEHCLEVGGPLADHARQRLLEGIGGNLYGAAAGAAFNHRLASTVDDGESLTTDRIATAFAETRRTFDPAVDWPDRVGRDWLFDHSTVRRPYHSYQYVLGVAGALAVRDQLADGTLSAETYRQFLRSTGRSPAIDSFRELGLDITTPAPYHRATATFDSLLDRNW